MSFLEKKKRKRKEKGEEEEKEGEDGKKKAKNMYAQYSHLLVFAWKLERYTRM